MILFHKLCKHRTWGSARTLCLEKFHSAVSRNANSRKNEALIRQTLPLGALKFEENLKKFYFFGLPTVTTTFQALVR